MKNESKREEKYLKKHWNIRGKAFNLDKVLNRANTAVLHIVIKQKDTKTYNT